MSTFAINISRATTPTTQYTNTKSLIISYSQEQTSKMSTSSNKGQEKTMKTRNKANNEAAANNSMATSAMKEPNQKLSKSAKKRSKRRAAKIAAQASSSKGTSNEEPTTPNVPAPQKPNNKRASNKPTALPAKKKAKAKGSKYKASRKNSRKARKSTSGNAEAMEEVFLPPPTFPKAPVLRASIEAKLRRTPSCDLHRIPIELRLKIYKLCFDVEELKAAVNQPLLEAVRSQEDLYGEALGVYYDTSFVSLPPPHCYPMPDEGVIEGVLRKFNRPQKHEQLLLLTPHALSLVKNLQFKSITRQFLLRWEEHQGKLHSALDLMTNLRTITFTHLGGVYYQENPWTRYLLRLLQPERLRALRALRVEWSWKVHIDPFEYDGHQQWDQQQGKIDYVRERVNNVLGKIRKNPKKWKWAEGEPVRDDPPDFKDDKTKTRRYTITWELMEIEKDLADQEKAHLLPSRIGSRVFDEEWENPLPSVPNTPMPSASPSPASSPMR